MTTTTDPVLVDVGLDPDPDPDNELGVEEIGMIGDHELQDCRFLITRRAVEGIDLLGVNGGLLKMSCSFQGTAGARFVWARIVIKLDEPADAMIIDVAPSAKLEDRPVNFTVDSTGKLGAEYGGVEAGLSSKTTAKFETFHCSVQGTGAGTRRARWEFREDPSRKEGLAKETPLIVTLRGNGLIKGTVTLNAKVVREGVAGLIDAARHLFIKGDEHFAPLIFEVPEPPTLALDR